MRTIILLFYFTFIIYNFSISQGCLPDGINFNTQEEIDSFQTNYPGCTIIEGDVTILGSDITQLNGLSLVETIEGNLEVYYCDVLVDFSGFESLETVNGNFRIEINAGLVDLTGLENLETIGGNLEIWVNDELTSLIGLSSLNSIGGGLEIMENIDLVNLSGLESLVSIGGDLNIQNNYDLENISALGSLIAIENDIIFYNNSSLQNLDGLSGVSSIGGALTIKNNEALTDLQGLNNLTSIGEILKIDNNDALTSLAGLDNIAAESIAELHIMFNSSLSNCHVKSVCDFLAAPNGTFSVFANATGCTDPVSILEQCELSSDEHFIEKPYTIYPNPAQQKLNISVHDASKLKSIRIYNEIKQVLSIEHPGDILDISNLSQGLYFIKLETDRWLVKEKLIIQ